MPKKTPKSPYFFYMMHFKQQEINRGKHFSRGFHELCEAASDSWNKMNSQQRGPFEKMAKDDKYGLPAGFGKYTSQGVPISIIKKEEQDAHTAQKIMMTTIKQIVQDSYKNKTMATQEYYFVAGNYFCVTLNQTYFPAELAIIKFTFEKGIMSKLHTLINPEKLPLGFQYEAKSYSEDTHQLPIPPNSKGEKNYSVILQQVKEFLGGTFNLPPLFTKKKYIPMIESFFKEFCASADENPDRFKIYPLHRLFFDIKTEASKININSTPFQSIHVAEAQLNRDQYSYMECTACNYHCHGDGIKYCALSNVQKWAYIFTDHVCVDLNISLIVGQHFPPDVDISAANAMVNENRMLSMVANDDDTDNDGDDKSNDTQIISTSSVVYTEPIWTRRSPSQYEASSDEETFMGYDYHKAGPSKIRDVSPQLPDHNSSTSSDDDDPWTQRFGLARFNHVSRASSRVSASFENSFDSSVSRGLGRGSELFRNNYISIRGRGGHLFK